ACGGNGCHHQQVRRCPRYGDEREPEHDPGNDKRGHAWQPVDEYGDEHRRAHRCGAVTAHTGGDEFSRHSLLDTEDGQSQAESEPTHTADTGHEYTGGDLWLRA